MSDPLFEVDESGEDQDDSLVEHAPAVPLRIIFRRFWPYTRDFRGRDQPPLRIVFG